MRPSACFACWTASFAVLSLSPLASAWDATGHRMITWLAMDGLAKDAPDFLREAAVREAVGWQAGEPDRWRALKAPTLVHENAMDHFIDVEDLDAFGLTLSTISPLRYRFVRDMAIARHEHPRGPSEQGPPYNERMDPTGQKEWPGFAPHAVMDAYTKLQASFKTYRLVIATNDPARDPQLAMCRANIQVQMGILSHFVGDLSQPLHTTKHFNGWVGDNPRGYTTDKGFHAYIDGGLINKAKITYASLKAGQTFTVTLDSAAPWDALIGYIQASFDQVVPLYELQKSGDLDREAGRKFIEGRLHTGAAMLAGFYNAAWEGSAVTDKEVADFQRYDNWMAGDLPGPGRVLDAAPRTASPGDPAPAPRVTETPAAPPVAPSGGGH